MGGQLDAGEAAIGFPPRTDRPGTPRLAGDPFDHLDPIVLLGLRVLIHGHTG